MYKYITVQVVIIMLRGPQKIQKSQLRTSTMPAFDNIKVPKVNFDAKAAKAALVGASAGLAVASEAAQGCAKYALDIMKVRGKDDGTRSFCAPQYRGAQYHSWGRARPPRGV